MDSSITRAFDPVKQLWYQDIPGRGRVYDSPAAYGQSLGDPGGGAFHKNAQWDQDTGTVDRGLDWGKIYAWAIGAGLGAQAALAIANAAGAGGASGLTTGPTEPGAAASSWGAADTAGLTTGPVAPGAAASSWGPAGAAAGAGTDAVRSMTGGNTLEKLAAGLGGLLGGKALGHYLDPSGGVSPELTQLLQLSLDRAKSQQPLFNQVNSGVSQMLPNFASKDGLGKLMGG